MSQGITEENNIAENQEKIMLQGIAREFPGKVASQDIQNNIARKFQGKIASRSQGE